MEFFGAFFDTIAHLDEVLGSVAEQYGVLTYAILFFVITAETGLVVFPFLPGDSLLFAVGAFSAIGILNPWVLFVLLTLAGILGDAVNYAIGARAGQRLMAGGYRFMRPEYFERTQRFYERWGGRTIIIGRFLPIVRTFAPFLAGMARMSYPQFAMFNVVGAAVWVGSFLVLGYFFGNLPVVKENFGAAILAIIVISIAPALFEIASARFRKSEEARGD